MTVKRTTLNSDPSQRKCPSDSRNSKSPPLPSVSGEPAVQIADKPADEKNGKTPHPTWRHNGKVARLPKELRDKVNLMIEDGFTYPAIIKALGDAGKGFNKVNLSRWKDGGHQDWLLEQKWLATTRMRQESASDLTRDFDATQVNHAALQLITLHIFEAMRNLGPGTLDDKLGGDSTAFARLVHALSRASRETVQIQKYREVCAKARAALQALRDPKRKLSESENRSLVLQVDQILGMPSEDDPPPPASVRTESPLSSVALLAKEDPSLTTPSTTSLSASGGEG